METDKEGGRQMKRGDRDGEAERMGEKEMASKGTRCKKIIRET